MDLPCEQRFLSGMAFSICEVVRIAVSRVIVVVVFLPGYNLSDRQPSAGLRKFYYEKPLLERNLCSQGIRELNETKNHGKPSRSSWVGRK